MSRNGAGTSQNASLWTRETLRKIESGNPNVSFSNIAQVLRALGVLDQAVAAIDPLASDIGRLRAGHLTKKRAMIAVEVLVDHAGHMRLAGQAHITRARSRIPTTFVYAPGRFLDTAVRGPATSSCVGRSARALGARD